MAELKTKPTDISVETYLDTLDESKKSDASILIQMIEGSTKSKPLMWGTSIIGFGNKKYKYKSGREIDYFLIGFSVRKKAITLYLSIETNAEEFTSLGKHEKGVGCLYIQKLQDIDIEILKEIIDKSVDVAKNFS
ncbi:MAG: DUF1801 domain-containing protein [Firmicutes bacterium]|nr:DUF1801 domain-containing protein [Bacillota bacterium]